MFPPRRTLCVCVDGCFNLLHSDYSTHHRCAASPAPDSSQTRPGEAAWTSRPPHTTPTLTRTTNGRLGSIPGLTKPLRSNACSAAHVAASQFCPPQVRAGPVRGFFIPQHDHPGPLLAISAPYASGRHRHFLPDLGKNMFLTILGKNI